MSDDKGQGSPQVNSAQYYKKLATELADTQPKVDEIERNAENYDTTVA